jgi:RNA polymerase sigma-70 factor (ECF subfamily)
MAEIEEAVQRFINGDEEAFSLIVRRWERRIYNLAWRMLNNREDAQDVVQETFFSVFRSIRSLRAPESFSTWLYQIALNHCRVRRRSRNIIVPMDSPEAVQAGDKKHLLIAAATVSKSEDSLEIMDLIKKSLAGLSEESRTAIILKEYMGLSLEEMAGVMDCPLSTAKSHLYHGLQEVQRNLKRLGVEFKD